MSNIIMKFLWLLIVVSISQVMVVETVQAADFTVIMKTGGARLWDDQQTWDGVERKLDSTSSKIFSLAWEIRTADDAGFGMEYITYNHDFTPPVTGTTRSQYLLFSARKYYAVGSIFYPFVGVGLGFVNGKINDGQGNIDRDINLALQGSAGLELRFAKNFGFFTELKGLASGTDGEEENEFDTSATGFMAGVSFTF